MVRYRGEQENGVENVYNSLVEEDLELTGTDARSRNDRPKELPHKEEVIQLLRFFALLLFVLFFAFPALIKFYPGFLHYFIFPRYLEWPFHANYEDPKAHGLDKAFNFRIHVENNIYLGGWHILPSSLDVPADEKFSFVDSKEMMSSGHPVVVYMHGNAGYRGSIHRVELYKKLAEAGFHVVTFDYRGYGDSDGLPSRQGLVNDGLKVFKYVRKVTSNPNTKLIIWGHSLGASIALETAKLLNEESVTFDALVLESPFTNMYDIAHNHTLFMPFRFMPWFSWVFVEGIKSADIDFLNNVNILHVIQPIMILHAEDDFIVPHSFGKKLYETALLRGKSSKAKFVTFDSAENYGHKLIYQSPSLIHTIMNFIQETEEKQDVHSFVPM